MHPCLHPARRGPAVLLCSPGDLGCGSAGCISVCLGPCQQPPSPPEVWIAGDRRVSGILRRRGRSPHPRQRDRGAAGWEKEPPASPKASPPEPPAHRPAAASWQTAAGLDHQTLLGLGWGSRHRGPLGEMECPLSPSTKQGGKVRTWQGAPGPPGLPPSHRPLPTCHPPTPWPHWNKRAHLFEAC